MTIYLLNGCVRLNRGVAQLVSDRNYFLKNMDTWEEEVGVSDINILISVSPSTTSFLVRNCDF